MKTHGLQAYVVPNADPHQSEYVPDCWKRRQFLTGFSGSAGDALVTLKKAGLWTDSRYFLQAESELKGSGFALFRWGLPGVPSWQEWAAGELKRGDTLGLDPQVITHKDYQKLETDLGRRGVRVKAVRKNLVDEIWLNRPAMPQNPIVVFPDRIASESLASKLGRLRRKMAAESADAHVLGRLDSIAWLFNIRGSDVESNPVAIAYAIVTLDDAYLFVSEKKATAEFKKALGKRVKIFGGQAFGNALRELARKKATVWLDEAGVSQWIVNRLSGSRLFFRESPVARFKAVKNEAEISGARATQLRDGAAMIRFLFWLSKEVPKGKVSEVSAAKKLEELRARQENYRGLSFGTISAYAAHAAVVHYATSAATDIRLRPRGLYLIDSGSQYLEATTDVTRTVCLGRPTAEQKDRFSRVLKGLIALTRISFPQGTSGPQLDVLARRALWEKGLNYGHGTGHGVGAYLSVHEGPQAIAPSRGFGSSLEPGMIVSIEPGFYKEGEYGLRVENLVLVVKDKGNSGKKSVFYSFETLTLCPVELRLVEKKLLSPEEILWLNDYHQRVRKMLAPLLGDEEAAWLRKATRPI